MTTSKFHLRQQVVSSDSKDAAHPYGYVFAIRANGLYRIIFEDDTMRDVAEEYLEAEEMDDLYWVD